MKAMIETKVIPIWYIEKWLRENAEKIRHWNLLSSYCLKIGKQKRQEWLMINLKQALNQ